MSATWRARWKAIAQEIDGLKQTVEAYYSTQVRGMGDTTPEGQVLVPQSDRIFTHLTEFYEETRGSIPAGATERLATFFKEKGPVFATAPRGMRGHIQHRLAALAGLRAELDFSLADFGFHARQLADRAFVHLQRSIVVDDEVRDKWRAAFKAGEVKCEQLGAVHLLQHGIWAFKVDATGERTDLVCQDPLTDLAEVNRSAEALILTEWKKVGKVSELETKIADAKHQARRYASGSLSGLELRDHRYLIMVSEDWLSVPEDDQDGSVVYRHINIAVAPSTPSTSARRAG